MANKSNEENLKKLKIYSKDDIIEAIGRRYYAEYIIEIMLKELESKALQKARKDCDEAWDAFKLAMGKYSEWQHDMCVKYGDGKTVKLSDVPTEELKIGVELERILKQAEEAKEKCDKKFRKILIE